MRILLLEDMPADAELAVRELRKTFKRFEIKVIDDERSFIEALDTFKPEVIVSDYVMPSFDGLSALKIAQVKCPYKPFVILTGSMNEETAVKCMLAGADDYVIKEHIKRLGPAVTNAIKKKKIEYDHHVALGELRISEELNRSITETAADAIISINNEGNILSWNAAAQKMFGYSSEEMVSNDLLKIIPKTYQDGHKVAIERLQKHGRGKLFGKTIEITALHKSGNEFPIELSLSQWRTESQKFYTGIIRDTTERKHTEEALRESRDQYMALFNQIADPVVIFDQKSKKFLDCNTAMIDKYGYTKEELLQMTPFDLHPTKEELEKVKENIDDKDNVHPNEYMHKGKDGSIYNVETHTQEIRYKKTDAWITIVRDITERKKTESDLRSALEKATESDRLKSAFLATMSHELRTPLNAIIGFSDMFGPDIPKDEIIEYSKIINKSGDHLLRIIDDLFDIALIEAGQTKLKKTITEIQNAIENVHKIIVAEQHKTDKEELVLEKVIPPGKETLLLNTDPSKLKQILINLLKNALKFTHKGKISYGYDIDVVNHKSVLKFFVKDTGIGIPDHVSDTIFDSFMQLEDTDSRLYEGTGIGLSIAKKLVDLLGGDIWYESTEGKGSTFYFTLPYDGQYLTAKTDEVAELSYQNNLKDQTILIVEDDEESRELLEIILTMEKANCISTKHGAEAIDLCNNNPAISIVLMDINLPFMNGYDATAEIKKTRPGLPVIAQTALTLSGDQEKAHEAGCDDYIPKPFTKEKLLKTILKHLK